LNLFEQLEQRRLLSVEPLRVAADGRNLETTSGSPFFMQGDAAWSAVVATKNRAEVDQYLTDRASRGFNLVMVNLIERLFGGPRNQEGQIPFLTEWDFRKPNEAYFQYADYVINKANDLGLYVLLCPAYLGFPGTGSGWWYEILADSTDAQYQYGKFVGQRYANSPNVIWMLGGDRNADEAQSYQVALYNGIRDGGAKQISTAHPLVEFSTADAYSFLPVDLNATYTYATSYLKSRINYLDDSRPSFLLEDEYELAAGTPQSQRFNKWGSVLSGATVGAIMGNKTIWPFDPGWQDQLGSQLAQDMTRLGSFFRGLPDRALLRPSLDTNVLIGGQGTYTLDDYAPTSFSLDSKRSVTYLPTAREVTLNLAAFAQPVVAKWYDPSTGATTTSAAMSNTGRVSMSPPSTLNGTGTTDWVLWMEPATSAPPTGAPTAPSNLSHSVETSGRVTLTWTDASSNETGFRIERRYQGETTWTTAGTVGADATSYLDAGSFRNVVYEYRVVAFSAAGSNATAARTVDTRAVVTPPPPTPTTGPTAPTNLAATIDAARKPTLTWTDRSTDEQAFRVERRYDGETAWTIVTSLAPNATSYLDSAAIGNVVYQYRVVAVNAAGEGASAALNVATVATAVTNTIPIAPSELRAALDAAGKPALAWRDNSDNEAGFTVERRYRDYGAFEPIANFAPNVTGYTDASAFANVAYDYRIVAANSAGSAPSSSVSISTSTAVTSVPAAGTGSVSGAVFYDFNYNGTRDASEGGLADRVVYADLNNNDQVDAGEPSVTTDAQGSYTLSNLPAGTYGVRQVIVSGWYQSSPGSNAPQTVTIANNTVLTGRSFGTMLIPLAVATGASAGSVMIDRASNRIVDPVDIPARNIAMYYDANDNRRLDPGEPVDFTDNRGRYDFGNVRIRKMRMVRPVTMTTASPLAIRIVGPGAAAVFTDRNKNGRADSRDPALSRVRLFVDADNDGVLDAGELVFKTNRKGRFTFGDRAIDFTQLRVIGPA
jgi:hypothetical protein